MIYPIIILLCFFCGVCPLSILAQRPDTERDVSIYVERRGGQRFCGPSLTDALALVCGSMYNGPKDKRYLPSYLRYGTLPRLDFSNFDQDRSEENETGFGYESNSALFRHAFKRGVVDDCCKNSCTMKTLQSYCAPKNSV